MLGEGSIQERWHSPCSWVCVVFNTGTMAAVSESFTLKPHNSVSSCMSLGPLSSCPSTRVQGECLQARKSAYRSFQRMLRFQAALHLTQMEWIPLGFHSQMWWGLLFLVLESWARIFTPQQISASKISLPILNHTWVRSIIIFIHLFIINVLIFYLRL